MSVSTDAGTSPSERHLDVLNQRLRALLRKPLQVAVNNLYGGYTYLMPKDDSDFARAGDGRRLLFIDGVGSASFTR